jgi:hypothetical protein
MKRITDIVKHMPKPYDNPFRRHNVTGNKKPLPWYIMAIFYLFYLIGINIIISKNKFFLALTIKLSWVCLLIMQLAVEQISFATGFIAYVIIFSYILHFFDIFLLFACALFLPEGHRLIEDQ